MKRARYRTRRRAAAALRFKNQRPNSGSMMNAGIDTIVDMTMDRPLAHERSVGAV
jgi:hypothetical protein